MRKVQVTKSAFADFMLVFFTAESLSCSETTEFAKFLKGLRHMILSITVKEITFSNGDLIYVIRNVSFTFYLSLCLRRH